MVEYVLLLVLVVSLAAILVSRLVSRNADDPGILVAKWHNILEVIAEDLPDGK